MSWPAVIIMANCKTPLESALKTFVFFPISQPLIYLFQVPFAEMGWGLFRYYRHWFILTLLTFPAAYVGWYIRKKNWLSVLIFAPVLAYLGIIAYQSGVQSIRHFPRLLITALFCAAQIVTFLYRAADMAALDKYHSSGTFSCKMCHLNCFLPVFPAKLTHCSWIIPCTSTLQLIY